jgi:hypothetical protein
MLGFMAPVSLSVVIAGHSASQDARERAYDPAIHPLRKDFVQGRWTPGSSPGVTHSASELR